MSDVEIERVNVGVAASKIGEIAIIRYKDVQLLSHGTFGVVHRAKITKTDRHVENNGRTVAIKKTSCCRFYRNRELAIWRHLNHPNVVNLIYYFQTTETTEGINLKFGGHQIHFVMEYLPETLSSFCYKHQMASDNSPLPPTFLKVLAYQMFRGLFYIHSMGICHRDITPNNILVDPSTSVVKICDFGSARQLEDGERKTSYICARYYRAPELLFESNVYGFSVDIWSAGCVFGEMAMGKVLFAGRSAADQAVEIMKIFGTPNRRQIANMNPKLSGCTLQEIKHKTLETHLDGHLSSDGISLLSRILKYCPKSRINAICILQHRYFDELRQESCQLPNNQRLPPLFNFNEDELKGMNENAKSVLIY